MPGEEELLSGTEYEIVFFAGGSPDNATAEKKQGPGMGWYLQAYHVLSRATRKRLQRLYIVHPRTWVRVLIGVFGTIVSPKFRRKIVHVHALSALARHIPIETLLIPPSVYLHDRKVSPDIYVPSATGRRAFGVKHPFPKNIDTGKSRLPRVLRETTGFLLMPDCVKMEGLFRIPPNATLAGALKEAYDRGQHFIVWKEKGATVVQPGISQELLDEVRLEDAYGVHSAASLIKQWYRDLREPIFPEASYEVIKERFGSADVQIQPEELVDLILPESDNSPLSSKSRKILTRHLLPMLWEVAAYQQHNKMNPENLAICFSMCLICGSNQLEDAKVSSIVKRILQAAIDMWPELRAGMDLSPEEFLESLQAPVDSRDYEDPLEEELPPRSKHVEEDEYALESREGFRITMQDFDGAPDPEPVPFVPTLHPLHQLSIEEAPPLPPRPNSRPVSSGGVSPARSAVSATPEIPRRKPLTVDPPRYSAIFDNDDSALHVADSPSSYAPVVDGFGPPRHGPWSFDESEKKGFPPEVPAQQPALPILEVPKRKALSSETRSANTAEAPSNIYFTSRSSSDTSTLAQEAAQKAAATLAQQAVAAFAERGSSLPSSSSRDSSTAQGLETSTTNSTSSSTDDTTTFRKPTWPASSRPLQSLAKPSPLNLEPRSASTFPLASHSPTYPPATGPKPRTPSAGLLKRMESMEVGAERDSTGTSLESPRRLDLKKPSVEDLRRLYEERGKTVESLERAGSGRRSEGGIA